MKQPLSTFQKSLDAAFDVHLTANVQKTIQKRAELSTRLMTLRRAGLSLQKAACLFRTATAGDTVYLQQSHLLSQDFVGGLDRELVKAHNALLGISDVEHAGSASQRSDGSCHGSLVAMVFILLPSQLVATFSLPGCGISLPSLNSCRAPALLLFCRVHQL